MYEKEQGGEHGRGRLPSLPYLLSRRGRLASSPAREALRLLRNPPGGRHNTTTRLLEPTFGASDLGLSVGSQPTRRVSAPLAPRFVCQKLDFACVFSYGS